LAEGLRTEAVALRGAARTAVEAPLERLLEEYNRGDAANLRLVAAYLVALCGELRAAADARAAGRALPRAYATVEALKAAVRANLSEAKTVAQYAAGLGVSANHLTKCVRAVTGGPATALIAGPRIHEAKGLLRHTPLSVAEVAERLGYEDASYFARAFRTYAGCTPSAYRAGGQPHAND